MSGPLLVLVSDLQPMRRSALGALSSQRMQNTNGRFFGLTCSAHSPHVAFDRPQPSFGGPAAATCRCTISSQFPQMLALPFCSVNIHSNIIGFSFRSTISAKCTKHTADVRPYPTVRSFCTPVFPSGNDARRPPHRWAWIRGDGSDTKRVVNGQRWTGWQPKGRNSGGLCQIHLSWSTCAAHGDASRIRARFRIPSAVTCRFEPGMVYPVDCCSAHRALWSTSLSASSGMLSPADKDVIH